MIEEWKDIKGYEGLYKISSLGRIQNRHGRVLKTYIDQNKLYDGQKIRIYNHAKRRSVKMIKRLVAEAFIESVENNIVLIKNLTKPITVDNIVVLKRNRKGGFHEQ